MLEAVTKDLIQERQRLKVSDLERERAEKMSVKLTGTVAQLQEKLDMEVHRSGEAQPESYCIVVYYIIL